MTTPKNNINFKEIIFYTLGIVLILGFFLMYLPRF